MGVPRLWRETAGLLALVATPRAVAQDPQGTISVAATAHYFLAGGIPGEEFECQDSKVTFGVFFKQTVESLARSNYVDVLSFQGRLSGTSGIETVRRDSTEEGDRRPITWVVSDTKENCMDAAKRYTEVREALERSRWVGLVAETEARGRKQTGKGRVIFRMVCHQRRARDGSLETRCETVKPCRSLKIESKDPQMPVSLQLPCRSVDLMAN